MTVRSPKARRFWVRTYWSRYGLQATRRDARGQKGKIRMGRENSKTKEEKREARSEGGKEARTE